MAQTIIVTGASSGIGHAAASKFLDAGWQVGLVARRREALQKLAKGYENAHVLVADVTSSDAVAAVFRDFVASAGRLDALFNNAGTFGANGPIDEITLEDWHKVLDVNLNGMFYVARAAFAAMRAQSPRGGRIINNGSVSAHTPRPGSVSYTTTKHAITGLTKSLSLDGRVFDIACGQIDIGNARTAMIEATERRARAQNPQAQLQPTMQVDQAAAAVFYMASLPPEANVQFMTVMATKMPYVGRG